MQGNSRGTPETTAACIDAETLAAWADGGLSTSDAAAVETHLADCHRCTAMLATFTRTIPEAPVAQSLWTRWHLRWLVPAATAATVAALWVLVPRPDSSQMAIGPGPTNESQGQSSADNAANRAASAAPAETKEQEAPAPTTVTTPADSFSRREASPGSPQLTDEQRADPDAADKRLQSSPQLQTLPSAPPAAREADRVEEKVADARAEQFSAPAPSAKPAPAPPAAAAPSIAAESPAAAPTGGLGATSGARSRAIARQDRDFTLMFEVVSPDPARRWRVVSTGQVERSTNGGARWERATLPEAATLTGGSSPSASVCWLVGRSGSIYVTTDGLRFVRVPFPDRTDFVSIQATDGRRATVVTIDGRTMRTEDQGANWIRISP